MIKFNKFVKFFTLNPRNILERVFLGGDTRIFGN